MYSAGGTISEKFNIKNVLTFASLQTLQVSRNLNMQNKPSVKDI